MNAGMHVRNRSQLPKRFLQWGVPRTATTLQFVAMQACLCALGQTSVRISKTHIPLSESSMTAKRDSVTAGDTALFVTSWSENKQFDSSQPREPWQVEARELESDWKIPHGSIWYAQNVAAVAQRDWKIIEDYREVFALDEEEFGVVVQFMRLWDVLRRCCGPQMSLDYRMRLYGSKNYTPHLTSESMAWDACEMYDIDEVERLFMQSTLVNRCINLVHSLDWKISWSKLNGTFCSLYKNAAMNESLVWNKRPRGW